MLLWKCALLKSIPLHISKNSNRILTSITRYNSSGIQAEKCTVKGLTINYIKTGEGPKTLFCLPGALGTIWSDFKPQIEGLSKQNFTIIAWDPPGYGHSRPPNRNLDPKFYENDADAAYDFLKFLGVKKSSLLGWSDGGISSLILAAKHPDFVDKLVVWGSNSYVTSEDIHAYDKIRDVTKWSARMKAPLIELYTEKGLQEMWTNWCNSLDEIYANGGDICRPLLNDIKCPTFILHGDKDPMVAPEHPDYLASKIKNARLHRFPDGKHNIHLKYAEEFNKIISGFIME